MSTTIRRGFTLIELLVVVAIIAILIAILMPALARSKVQAKKTECLANLRSTFISIRQYGTEFEDVTPLGAWAYKQFNYIVFQGPRPSAYGLLVAAGYMTNGKAYYCPSYSYPGIGPSVAYDDQTPGHLNPWRGFPRPAVDPWPSNTQTRLGYGMRPLANWVPKDSVSCAPIAVWLRNPTTPEVTLGSNIQRWPKIGDFLNNAILADITSHYPDLLKRHKDGVNALYGSGAAYWVPANQFKDSLVGSAGQPSTSETDTNTNFAVTANPFMLDETVNPPTGMWADLDRSK